MIRFPEWARHDPTARLNYLCLVMSAYADQTGHFSKLAAKAGVLYPTALKGLHKGRFTSGVAGRLALAADGSGVEALWLVAPELIKISESGEVADE